MPAPDPVRILAAERIVFGGALSIGPAPLAHAVAGGLATPPTSIARVLGGRLLAQGVAELALPRARVLIAGSVIDLLHAVSMIATAVLTPRYRRVAVASATEAAFAAVIAAVALRTRCDR